ncbi:isocitrate lyase/phosphoenolpyruvate mutase family protein [Streptomyces sp. NPDC059373]
MNRSEQFRALHRPGRPLLLPNAWDHASAAALSAHGFPAIGTTSLGVAAAAGLPDATGATRDETRQLALGLARLPALVTVDIEGGFSEDPGEVAALAAELAGAGVVGVNIEDGRADESLADPAHQSELIAAIKHAAPELFVNARTDTYWLPGRGQDHGHETLPRAEAYLRAGADGVFVPGLQDASAITALVTALDAPLNILFATDGLSRAHLAGLGVSRISTGSLLFRAALHSAVELADAIAQDQEPAPADLPTYAQAQRLAAAYRLSPTAP